MSSSVRVTAPTTNSSSSSSRRPVNHDAHLPTPKTGDKFVNPWPSYHGSGTPMDFLIAKLRGEIPLGAVPTDVQSQVGWQALKQAPNAPERLKAAWLGHASLYFEFPSRLPSSQGSTPPIGSREKKKKEEKRGIRILVDPIFSGRCSPTQFFGGPKRYTAPATSVDALEGIDVLCLSHNHYDHLDSGTITRLHKKFPQLVYFVPLRVRDWFLRCGIDAAYVHEMDWWEELIYERGDDDNLRLKIGYLPAQHFTGRSLRDQGATLWGSFALTELLPGDEEGKKVYFAGDTGRRTIPRPLASALKSEDGAVRAKAQVELDALPTCPAHKEIRAFRGPFDLVVIPIGAYEPRHFMSRVHVDPGEAVDIFVDLTTTPAEPSTPTTTIEKSRKTVGLGVHWGTFQLSYEDVLEPRRALARITKERNIQDFGCWKIGELVEL